jgi:desulfoferrodoxin (superoxide reductase-like protein)
MNGMVRPEPTAYTKFKHTQNINIQGAADKVRVGVEAFLNEESRWQQWAQVRVSDIMAEEFFKHTLAKVHTHQSAKFKQNDKQLENLLGIWHGEKATLGPNKWALYNTMTYWSTHTHDSKNPLVAQQMREEKVISAINSKEFAHLEVF